MFKKNTKSFPGAPLHPRPASRGPPARRRPVRRRRRAGVHPDSTERASHHRGQPDRPKPRTARPACAPDRGHQGGLQGHRPALYCLLC